MHPRFSTAPARPPHATQAANDRCPPGDTPLARLLCDAGVVSPQRMARARREAVEQARRILDVLVEDGLVDDDAVAAVLSFELGVPWVNPALIRYDVRLTEALPRWVAEALCVLPVYFRESSEETPVLYLAMDDPTDEDALLACSIWTGFRVRPLVASTTMIRDAIRAWYPPPARAPLSHVELDTAEEELEGAVA